jgi:hypothetical protein
VHYEREENPNAMGPSAVASLCTEPVRKIQTQWALLVGAVVVLVGAVLDRCGAALVLVLVRVGAALARVGAALARVGAALARVGAALARVGAALARVGAALARDGATLARAAAAAGRVRIVEGAVGVVPVRAARWGQVRHDSFQHKGYHVFRGWVVRAASAQRPIPQDIIAMCAPEFFPGRVVRVLLVELAVRLVLVGVRLAWAKT